MNPLFDDANYLTWNWCSPLKNTDNVYAVLNLAGQDVVVANE